MYWISYIMNCINEADLKSTKLQEQNLKLKLQFQWLLSFEEYWLPVNNTCNNNCRQQQLLSLYEKQLFV